jgi:hypothetical protein
LFFQLQALNPNDAQELSSSFYKFD